MALLLPKGEIIVNKEEKNENKPSVNNINIDGRESIYTNKDSESKELKGDASMLWNTWNALENQEEEELVESYREYEELFLKCIYKQKEPNIERKSTQDILKGFKAKAPLIEDNLQLPNIITFEYVEKVVEHLKMGNLMPKYDIVSILTRLIPILRREPNIIDFSIKTKLTIVGDLHGQLADLLNIFKLNGYPSARNQYIFNGDFVDRGKKSMEILTILFLFKLLYPEHVILNRGNHESRDMNSRGGFQRECVEKYDFIVYDVIATLFATLPLATLINKKIFVCHGGLFWEDITLTQLNSLNRFHEVPPRSSLMEQILWSDPSLAKGRIQSTRGAGLKFGPDVSQKFCTLNNIDLIVRSHQCQRKGYKSHHDGRVLTIFSASNYCGVVGNDGAYAVFENNNTSSPLVVPYYTTAEKETENIQVQVKELRNNILQLLKVEIAEHRLQLIKHYKKLDNNGYITHQQFFDGLRSVLKIDITFHRFQTELNIPSIDIDGKKEGKIDYMHFLSHFRILHQLLPQNNNIEDDDVDHTKTDVIETLVQFLYKNRLDLECLFRFFDSNGDGNISVDEFVEGVEALFDIEKASFDHEIVVKTAHSLDANKNGFIEYMEFAQGFQIEDN